MKISKVLKFVKKALKYVVPALVGWLEGDTHAVVNALAGLLSIF